MSVLAFPKEWRLKKLDDYIEGGVIELNRGNVISKKDIIARPGSHPIYSSSVHNQALFGCYGDHMFDEELITWSVDGGGNFFYRPKHKFSVTNVSGILRIKDTSRFFYKYLYYLLDWEHASFKFDYQAKAHPSVIRKMYDIVEPPLSEQKKIAEILGAVDEEIQKTDEIIATTEKLKKGLMQQLFTRGIGHTKFVNTKLGKIPEAWQILSLQEMLDENYVVEHLDGNHGELYPKSSEFVEEGIPYLSANCLVDGNVDFLKAKHLSPGRASKFVKGVAINGDILFAHNATVGPVARLNTFEKYVILSTTLTYYRCNNLKLASTYLMYFMQSPLFIDQYKRVMMQTTRNQVPITMQRTFLHALPLVREQKQIAEILSSVDDKISVNQKLKAKLTLLKKGLMQDLLSGKIRTN